MILNVPSKLEIHNMECEGNKDKNKFQENDNSSIIKEVDDQTQHKHYNDDIHKKEATKSFFGISLSRQNNIDNDTITHQTVFDFNELCDRSFEYIESINDDDGWRVGGGEMNNKDTAHIELLQIGTTLNNTPAYTNNGNDYKYGSNLEEEDIIQMLYSGNVIIPEIEIVPTSMFLIDCDGDSEYKDICLRFEMLPSIPDFNDIHAPLPINWSLRFIQNQLLHSFPTLTECSDFFHMVVAKRVKFKSSIHQTLYLGKCFHTLKQWKQLGSKSLNNGGWDIDGSKLDDFINNGTDFHSGIWLYENKHNIVHFTPPNFLPPYDTNEKMECILKCISKEWDNESKQWKDIGYSFMRDRMARLKELNSSNKCQGTATTIATDATTIATDATNNSLVKVDYASQGGCSSLFCGCNIYFDS